MEKVIMIIQSPGRVNRKTLTAGAIIFVVQLKAKEKLNDYTKHCVDINAHTIQIQT